MMTNKIRYLLALSCVAVASQSSPTPPATTAISNVAGYCEARTINYITHSLPQACLTSTRDPLISKSHTVEAMAPTDVPTTQLPDTVTSKYKAEEVEEQLESPDAAPTPFMSFEDWKEMMLKKAGQDPQALKIRKNTDISADERQRYSQDSGQESLGDEGEIELNFNEYSDSRESRDSQGISGGEYHDTQMEDGAYEVGRPAIHRNKDAGKTCKERFSYASFDAGATIVKAGGGAKNAKAILGENKDTYMLMECATANKYVIVELTDDVQIDTIVLANFEFFSSMIRYFRVSVSDRYPVKADKWLELGTFEARNSREIQPFLVENPQIWAKFIRIEFLTHYGNEYYCPLSLLRIHGSRLLDSWRDSETTNDDDMNESDDTDAAITETEISGVVMENLITESVSGAKVDVVETSPLLPFFEMISPEAATCAFIANATANEEGREVEFSTQSTNVIPSVTTKTDGSQPTSSSKSYVAGSDEAMSTAITTTPPPPTDTAPSTYDSSSLNSTTQHVEHMLNQTDDSVMTTTTNAASTKLEAELPSMVELDSNTVATTSKSAVSAVASASAQKNVTAPGNTTTAKSRGTPVSGSAMASPTVQDGVFNAMAKRLQNVESSLSLSLKYIEEQSKYMQQAFQQSEKKQSSRVSSVLEHLNTTVIAELRAAREQYEEIWQSTVLALDGQKDRSQQDILALSSRLNLLADEVVFQKRMTIIQAVLLLCCLCLVIFSRGGPLPYLAQPQDQSSSFSEILSAMQRRDSFALRSSIQSHVAVGHRQETDQLVGMAAGNMDARISPPESPNSDHMEYHFQRPSPPITPTREEKVEEEWPTPDYKPQIPLSFSAGTQPLPSLAEHPDTQ